MEDIFAVYERPAIPKRPVVCFGDRRCQLREGRELSIRVGAGGRRDDSHNKRNGTCCVLLSAQPRWGERVLDVRPPPAFARLRAVSEAACYPGVSDRGADRAGAELPRFAPDAIVERNVPAPGSPHVAGTVWRTPHAEKGSWLNVAEIEFSAMAKQCLDRRMGSIGELPNELQIWERGGSHESSKMRH